jgi:hypothetical protein
MGRDTAPIYYPISALTPILPRPPSLGGLEPVSVVSEPRQVELPIVITPEIGKVGWTDPPNLFDGEGPDSITSPIVRAREH